MQLSDSGRSLVSRPGQQQDEEERVVVFSASDMEGHNPHVHQAGEQFLKACKNGDREAVEAYLRLGGDVNYQEGWGLRRAIRYKHSGVWGLLLRHRSLQVNMPNQYGLTALHTACRFNVSRAIQDLLDVSNIDVNVKTSLGSSPLMVAVKYCRKEAVRLLLADRRVELYTVDGQQRVLEEVVGVAASGWSDIDRHDIIELIQLEKLQRKEEEGRRDSIDEEGGKRSGRDLVCDRIKSLMAQLHDIHVKEMARLTDHQEKESRCLLIKQECDIKEFLKRQDIEKTEFLHRVLCDKSEFDRKQKDDVETMIERHENETITLQKSLVPEISYAQKHPGSRKTSRTGSPPAPTATTPAPAAATPFGGLHPLAEPNSDILEAAKKDLECPICLEVMAPPARIWQCETGHIICETCKDRVNRTVVLTTTSTCPTCKTAPFIGRNLALERISRSLFVDRA